jgi:hypothetical protein
MHLLCCLDTGRIDIFDRLHSGLPWSMAIRKSSVSNKVSPLLFKRFIIIMMSTNGCGSVEE